MNTPNAKQFKNIVILTGAGISAESGIQTFRASDGLWHNHRIEDVASPEGFKRNPSLVHEFYNARRQQLHDPHLKPNAAHFALAELEKKFQGKVLLVTQNVDNLHERAGSQALLHMHGELNKVRCVKSQKVFPQTEAISIHSVCACCHSAGNLRPDIVWFGEMPMYMDEIYEALTQCDLFIAIGTSGHVYPAAGFVQIAGEQGAHTVELNLEPSAVGSNFHEAYYGLASQVVPQYIAKLLNQTL